MYDRSSENKILRIISASAAMSARSRNLIYIHCSCTNTLRTVNMNVSGGTNGNLCTTQSNKMLSICCTLGFQHNLGSHVYRIVCFGAIANYVLDIRFSECRMPLKSFIYLLYDWRGGLFKINKQDETATMGCEICDGG